MKPISKSARAAFNAEIAIILDAFTPCDAPHQPGSVRCMTDCGPLTIHPDPLEHGDTVATVLSRFRDTDNPEFMRRCGSLDSAQISGKWNIHEFDPDRAVSVLQRRLAWVNARTLTESEAREWNEKDVAEAAYWERMRNEHPA